MDILSKIHFGHKSAIKRVGNDIIDRKNRLDIEKANHNGDCIINVGNGYYRPIPGDPVDDKEFDEYMAIELGRSRKILAKRLSMKQTRERWRECGVPIDNTREIRGAE